MLQKRTQMPTLTRWAPFDELRDMQQQINYLFGDLFGRVERPEAREFPWEPAVDVVEKEDEFLFKFELPGMKMKDIKVTVEGDYLVITGERKWEHDEDKERVHRVERSYGSFRRELRLPNKVDPGKVEAKFHDGVLEVHLPVLEIAKPRVVEVQHA